MSKGNDVRLVSDVKVIGKVLTRGIKGYFVEEVRKGTKLTTIVEINGAWYEVPSSAVEVR